MKNYGRERADRILRGIFHTRVVACAAPAAGPVGPSDLSIFVLLTVARALVEVEGGLGCCWYNCCCEWEDDGDGAEDVEWECWRLGVGVRRWVLMREAGRKMGRMERRIC